MREKINFKVLNLLVYQKIKKNEKKNKFQYLCMEKLF